MGIVSSAFRMVDEFVGEHKFLSNFYYSPFKFQGMIMPTGEHAFQSAKPLKMEQKLWVVDAKTPGIAKRRGRQVDIRPDWEAVKLNIMLAVVRSKFSSAEMRHMLISTKAVQLTEGNYWHDQYWGNCMCESHAYTPGRNYLGKILMYIRKEL